MICLGLSTSTDQGSVAVLKNKKMIAQSRWTRRQHQSEIITIKIKSLLKKSKIKFKDLDCIAVDKGPGSFTGVRIAVNVAKTFSYTLNKPLFVADSLDLLAHAFSSSKKTKASFPQTVIALIDAHKNLFYFKHYRIRGPGHVKSSGPALARSLDDISKLGADEKKIFVIGELSVEVKEVLKEAFKRNSPATTLEFSSRDQNFPDASTLVLMAEQEGLGRDPEKWSDWQHLEPCYIRAPDAVEKWSNPSVRLTK